MGLGELPLRLLEQHHGARKHWDIANMVDVTVGETDVADGRWLDAKLFKLFRHGIRDDPIGPAANTRYAAGYLQELVWYPRAPQKIASCMVDQVTVVR